MKNTFEFSSLPLLTRAINMSEFLWQKKAQRRQRQILSSYTAPTSDVE